MHLSLSQYKQFIQTSPDSCKVICLEVKENIAVWHSGSDLALTWRDQVLECRVNNCQTFHGPSETDRYFQCWLVSCYFPLVTRYIHIIIYNIIVNEWCDKMSWRRLLGRLIIMNRLSLVYSSGKASFFVMFLLQIMQNKLFLPSQ